MYVLGVDNKFTISSVVKLAGKLIILSVPMRGYGYLDPEGGYY